jgi:choline-sulfatase
MKTTSRFILALLVSLCAIETSHAAGKRPNILFIIADDQSPFDFKFYNPRSALDSPVLEKLATEGMVIDGAYQMGSWVGGVCTASRHMIMSGRTLWHVPDKAGRIMNPHVNNPKMVPPDLVNYTLPAVFNRAGYDTMRTCKNGNSYEAANKLFQVRHDGTRREGTDERGSAWHAEQVLDYLNNRESAKDTDPFLIYFGFSHPHDTRDGKPGLLAKYGALNHTDKETIPPANPKQPPLPVNYLPAHPFDHGHTTVRDEVGVEGVWKRRDERTIRNEIGREFACSENIDIQIGRVLEKLGKMGELDNTYIIYTADHGMAIGRHGLQGKQNLYEHTWRIPFIVKGPGIKAGSRAQGNIYLLDVLSTVSDLAGIKAPVTTEGISFRPVLEGRKQSIREVMHGVYCGGGRPGSRCVRKGDWKLTQYEVAKTGVQHTQLFNLKENPHEFMKEHHAPAVKALSSARPEPGQVNLASDPKHAAKLKEMQEVLLAEMRRHDDPYRLWNQPDDGLPVPLFRERNKNKQPKKPRKNK